MLSWYTPTNTSWGWHGRWDDAIRLVEQVLVHFHASESEGHINCCW